MKRTFACIALAGILAAVLPAAAQNLEDFASKYTEENGKGYVQPVADAFGACLNSGLYHGAKISRAGFHLTLGIETMTAVIGGKQKTFDAETGEFFYPPQTVEAPTIFGAVEGVTAEGQAGTEYAFPGGMNVSRVPLAVPQVTVGSIAGTEATFRWMSMSLGEDFGSLKLTGWGVRHSLSQYLPLFPVALAVGYYSQSFTIGDIVDASATYVGVQGSVSAGILTAYAGLGVESSNLDISYEFEDTTDKIEFKLKGGNRFRTTIGAALGFPGFRLHADYNIAKQNVLALGVGVGF